jgi:Tol biopolymer transport system component/DNA-binding winged helix-turn-helix (wHTH) protein
LTRFGDAVDGAPQVHRFGAFTLDIAAFRLTRNGEPIRIEPKALEVLAYLIQHPDRVVSKDELLDAVWKGTFVTPNALTRAVAQIRKALSDNADSPQYIETVPTRGYRFVGAEASAIAIPPAPPSAPVKTEASMASVTSKIVILAVIGFIAIVAVSMLRSFLDVAVRLPKEFKGPTIRRPTEPPRIAAAPLVKTPGLHVFPSFSPDGLRIAYASDSSGILQIYVVDRSGENVRQLTTDPEGAMQPSWSSDGKQIAFVAAKRGGIRVMPSDGGAVRQLTKFGSRPAWGPEDEIVFQSGEQMEFGGAAFEAQPPSSLWIVNVSSGRVEPLTRPGQPAGGHGAPSWRRDGIRIAFASCEIERCAIYTVGRDGSSLREVARESVPMVSPLFAPHGRTLYYLVNRWNGSALLAVPIDPDGERKEWPQVLRRSGPAVMQHLAISRDGSQFAWSVVEESSRIVSLPMSANGKPASQEARAVTTQRPGTKMAYPAFSPDGTKIAWSAIGAGDDNGIWMVEADGENEKPVSVGPRLKQNTQWGSAWEVSYSLWLDEPALLGVSLISGESKVLARLPRDASVPMISFDRLQVAFNRSIGNITTVWLMSMDGSDLRRLTAESDLARNPIWSPKGTQLAVQVRRPDGTAAVAVVPAKGGALRILTTAREASPYSWSPDERFIAYAARRDGVWNIFAVHTGTRDSHQLTSNDSIVSWLRSPVWSPDGKRMILESGTTSSALWISNPAAVR